MATDIYENRPQSFLTNIEPIANQMQNIALKLQNFLSSKEILQLFWICLLNLMMEKVVQRNMADSFEYA
jgi:hypothetical protein